MTDIEIRLPWPDRRLSPNERVHWAVKNRVTQQAKMLARAMTLEQLHFNKWQCPSRPMIVTYLHPPRYNSDIDNLHAMLKSSFDGICQALQIDDRCFRASIEVIGERVKKGLVIVQIRSSDGLGEFLGMTEAKTCLH